MEHCKAYKLGILGVLAGGLLLWVMGCSESKLLDGRNPYYIQGIRHRRQSEYKSAADAFKKCLRVSPQSADAHLQLGMLYEDHLHQPVSALHHYQSYMRLRPAGDNAQVAEESVERIQQRLGEEWAALYGVGRPRTDEIIAAEQVRKKLYKLEEQKAFLLKKLRETNRKLIAARHAQERHRAPSRRLDDQPQQTPASATEDKPVNKDQGRAADTQREELYTVKKGDTLFSIARRKYGNASLWDELQSYNQSVLNGRNELIIGETIRLPSPQTLRGALE